MSESRRVTSTARSIQRSWLWRLFKLYFWLDLLLFVLSFQVERNWVFGQKDKKGIQQSSRR